MTGIVSAGNKGEKVRSDCHISIEILKSGGINLDLKSKVKSLYGRRIHELLHKILHFYEITHAAVNVEDSGALDFIIAARMEAAVKKINPDLPEFLLPVEESTDYETSKDRFRFSRLYLPGNTPSMMINAGIHHPDGIILDLEDSVAPERKFEARFLVRNSLRNLSFYGAEKMVRINQYPEGLEDLKYVIPHNVHVILIPKCENSKEVLDIEKKIALIIKQTRRTRPVYLMPIIESAAGVENAWKIASSSNNIVALAIGLEDYTADIGVQRTQEGSESFYARTRIVNACKAFGIQAIDSVYSDVSDEEGLRNSVKESKKLGFEGMGCIHPRQIKIIHESFAPEREEIEKAEKIVNAFIQAEKEGLGVVSLGTKMIDPPVVKRAQRTIDLAIKMNLIDKTWREKYE